MSRKVTFKAGTPGAERDITVEVHDLDADPWGLDAKLRTVGTDVPRLDGVAKATGAARYTFDVNRPNLAYAKALHAWRAHARVVAIDLSRADRTPGVLATEPAIRPGERVTFAGQPVAYVCAETEEAADDALAAIDVTYEPLPHAVTTGDALKDDAPRPDPKNPNVSDDRPQERGDVDQAFAEAGVVVVEAEFRTQVQTHTALEPHGCVVEPDGDGFTVWASTQSTQAFQSIAGPLGVRPNQVRIRSEHVGGGFGAKFGPSEWDRATAMFAKRLNRPVKQLLSRRAEHLIAGNRPDSIQRLKLAGRKDGTLTALAGETFGTPGNGKGGASAANSRVYRFGALRVKQASVSTFTGSQRAFRAPGHPQGFFAMEGIVDMFAHAIGMDPLELRVKNDPHPVRQAQWKIGAERIAWTKTRRKVPGADKGPVKRGVGCAAGLWFQAGGGNWVVNLHVARDGTVTVQNAVQDIGTGIRTAIAVLTAEELGIAPDAVDVQIGDTRFPAGPGSGGSTTTPSIGPAVREAGLRAREGLAAALATEWKCEAGEVRPADAGGFVGPRGRKATFREACALLGPEGLSVTGQRRNNYDGYHRETAGCQFAQVAVDVETGVIRVEKVVAVHDAGRIVDALTSRSQVNGGVIQGVSYALYEDRRLDRATGDMVNPTLDTYRITGMNDCPEIDVVLTTLDSGFNNAGIMGLGEPATVPTAAAIANAVFNATGVRLTEIPMTPARYLDAQRRAAK